jgi:WD repeat-containing protein 45
VPVPLQLAAVPLSLRVIVALRSKVFVYTLANTPKLLYVFETCENERGLLALSTDDDVAMLAFPARRRGYIQIVDLRTYIASPAASPMFPPTPGEFGGGAGPNALSASGSSSSNNSPSAWAPPSSQRIANTSFITAHSSDLSCLAISPRGKKIASTSEKVCPGAHAHRPAAAVADAVTAGHAHTGV